MGLHEPQNKTRHSVPAHCRCDRGDAISSRRHLEILAGLDISGGHDDSHGGGVYLFLRARSAISGAQAAGQGKNRRTETNHEVREADLHDRLPASGFRFPVRMVAQNFRRGACLADDLFGSNCSRRILDDVLGHEREQLRFADHTSGKRSARHFHWALLFTPLALGSYWAVPVFALVIPVIVLRILNEEKILRQELAGYSEYCQNTRSRLIPLVW